MIETNNNGCTVQKFLSKDWDALLFENEAIDLGSQTKLLELRKRRWDTGGETYLYATTSAFFVLYSDMVDVESRVAGLREEVRSLAAMLEADRIDYMIEPEVVRRAHGGMLVHTSLTFLRRKRC